MATTDEQVTLDKEMQEYLEREYAQKIKRKNEQDQMDKVVKELADQKLTDYDKKLKDHKAEVKDKLKTKNVAGKQLIVRGVIDEITPIKSNFGYSWRLKLGGSTLYYNSKFEYSAEKMNLKAGEKLACTVKESGKYLVIETIFYTF